MGGWTSPPDTAQRRGEGGERWGEVENGTLRSREELQGGVLGLAEKQKRLEVFKGLGKRSGGGWRRGGTARARQGSGALGGVTGSSVTCPPLTKAICCR